MDILAKFHQFAKDNYGKSLEAEDPNALYQCMDAAFKWCDYLGIPRDTIRHGAAYQVFTQLNPDTKQYFDVLTNGPLNAPETGDLVIFGQAVGPYGHICIATGIGDSMSFLSMDQNWSGKQMLWPVDHIYRGVLGWLRPKV